MGGGAPDHHGRVMTASAFLVVVGAWTLTASILALILGAVIDVADRKRFRPANDDVEGGRPNVTVPAPRSEGVELCGRESVPASVAPARITDAVESVSP